MTVQTASRRAGSRGPRTAGAGSGRGGDQHPSDQGSGLLALVSGALFLLLAAILVRTSVFTADDRAGSLEARDWLGDHPGSPLVQLVHLGDAPSVVVVVGLVAVTASLAQRRWRPVVGSAATLVVLAGAVGASKVVMGRIPPTSNGARSGTFFTDGSAFPSGHTAGTLVTLLLVASLVAGPGGVFPSRALYAVLVVGSLGIAAGVGAVTVALGWHWPTDVAGGALLAGVVWSIGRALVHRAPQARTD